MRSSVSLCNNSGHIVMVKIFLPIITGTSLIKVAALIAASAGAASPFLSSPLEACAVYIKGHWSTYGDKYFGVEADYADQYLKSIYAG